MCLYSIGVRLTAVLKLENSLEIEIVHILGDQPMLVPTSLENGFWELKVDEMESELFFANIDDSQEAKLENFESLPKGGAKTYRVGITDLAVERIRKRTTWMYFHPNPNYDDQQMKYFGSAEMLHSSCEFLAVMIEL